MTPKKTIALCVGIYLLIAVIGTIAFLADTLPDHPHTKHGWLLLFFVFAPLYFLAEGLLEWIFETFADLMKRMWHRIAG